MLHPPSPLDVRRVRKVRRQQNGDPEIALAGLLVLVTATVVGGYGKQDDLPDPQFIQAFSTYFGPAMLVTVIELVRLDRRKIEPVNLNVRPSETSQERKHHD